LALADTDNYSLNRFLSYVDSVDKWKLMHREYILQQAIAARTDVIYRH
jgi:hypothetical protein